MLLALLFMTAMIFATGASAGPDVAKSAMPSSAKVIERLDLERIFKQLNVEGSFLVYDTRNDTFTAVHYG